MTRPLVSVLTPSIPERQRFLNECIASVKAQTVWCYEHLIKIDADKRGCAVTMNELADNAKGMWVLPLADDDVLLPRALETLLEHKDEGDIIYAPPLVTGNEDRFWFFQAPPVLPSFALIRKSLWDDLGGYDEALAHEEDRDLWIKALEADATFVRVNEPVWVYRQHQSNKSFNKVAA